MALLLLLLLAVAKADKLQMRAAGQQWALNIRLYVSYARRAWGDDLEIAIRALLAPRGAGGESSVRASAAAL